MCSGFFPKVQHNSQTFPASVELWESLTLWQESLSVQGLLHTLFPDHPPEMWENDVTFLMPESSVVMIFLLL